MFRGEAGRTLTACLALFYTRTFFRCARTLTRASVFERGGVMEAKKDAELKDDREVAELVEKFESGELPPSEFKHRAHLTVALWYQTARACGDPLAQMRRSILNYLERNGIDPALYNETLTSFWMRRVRAFVERDGGARPLYASANRLFEECGDSRLVAEYYSEAIIKSFEARRAFVEPDLKPLDF